MSQNVFLADLHYSGGEDESINQLLTDLPTDTRRIFLLGDIFDYWVNDPPFIEQTYAPLLARFQRWADAGVQLFFIEGNRDFLASHFLDKQPWIDVLANPTILDLGGRMVYIGHGDELCWDDWAYQCFKCFIRSIPMRFLADRLPSFLKQMTARRMKKASETLVAAKDQMTLAVPHRAYEAVFHSGVEVIVHGHLHDTYQREYRLGDHAGQVYCFGWKDGKRNLIHFAG